MNYGNIVNAQESSSASYLKHGINENVIVDKVEYKEISTPNYNGAVIDVSFKNDKGAIADWRIFPFNFNSSFVHKGGDKKGKPVTEEEQFNNYLANKKHVFAKAIGEENFGKVMTKVVDFKSLGTTLSTAVEKLPKLPFNLMLIDKGGYPTIPNWTGGFCSYDRLELEAKWDEDKYGKKNTAPTTANTEKPAESAAVEGDKLPWE